MSPVVVCRRDPSPGPIWYRRPPPMTRREWVDMLIDLMMEKADG